KTQVTIEYEDGVPKRLCNVLISTQHEPGLSIDGTLKPALVEHVVRPLLPEQFAGDDFDMLVNPTGSFGKGGPHADCGLTGRKIIVDTYGGMARHGGGAFSGKDPTKVDRSAAYAVRNVAKNVVAAGIAKRCEVQAAYAIGVARPISVMVESFGTSEIDPLKLGALVQEHFDLRPTASSPKPSGRTCGRSSRWCRRAHRRRWSSCAGGRRGATPARSRCCSDRRRRPTWCRRLQIRSSIPQSFLRTPRRTVSTPLSSTRSSPPSAASSRGHPRR